MLPLSTGREANTGESVPPYVRYRPERPPFNSLLKKYYLAFEAQFAVEDRMLPDYVQRKFEDCLKIERFGTWFPACTQ